MKLSVKKLGVEFCPRGMTAGNINAGDFILVSDSTFFAKLVQLGQAFRFHKNPYTNYNHCALIISPDGNMVEADGKTVTGVPIQKYENYDYYIVRIDASPQDRDEVVKFAESTINESYGWATILSIGISLFTGLKFSFGFEGQEICSGLIARALERTTAIFPTDPSHITPCQLAQYYLQGGDTQ